MEYSRVISSRSSSTVSSIKLKGHREVLGDERVVIMASKAVDISHHTRRAMEYLKEVTKKFLGPLTNLMDIGPSYLKISLMALQSQIQNHSAPQRNFRF